MKSIGIFAITAFLLLCAVISIFLSSYGQTPQPHDSMGRSTPFKLKIINGQWFTGDSFEMKTVWIENAMLRFDDIGAVDTVVDLSGQYVIPPFAEAHNHNLESDYQLEKRIKSYMDHGVFYVKHLSSIKKRIDPLMHHYNKPTGIDVSLAHAPLTASGGHPIALRKKFLEWGHFDGLFNSLEEIEAHGYFIIENQEDLEDKWDQILSFSPDFIKINLLHSEEFDLRKDDTTYFGRKGLDPQLVPVIITKAHEHNLRVSAHVATAYDFEVAVSAGVDEVAHLPEIHNGKAIARKDAKVAAERGIIVVTTASLVEKNKDKPNYRQLVENVRMNLMLLKEEQVILAIGSDGYNDNSVGEFEFLRSLDIFSNHELLKMWCENAALTTFPDRKIAYLRDGYEASFLVVNTNPLEEISDISEKITLKVKQGVILK